MKRIPTYCFVALGFLACAATGYLVHEEPEEDDETIRGKRQQEGTAVIDSIFNIPIQVIKQTAQAAQTLSPDNAGTIDSVLKIPVTTLEAVSTLIKNRQQNRYPTTPLSTSRPIQRRSDQPTPASPVNEALLRQRELIQQRIEAQREQQRIYQEQLHRRHYQQLQQYNRRMQQQIAQEDERAQHRFYRDPFGFNAIAKWVVGPRGVFNGHAGHGDGHVYQYFNQQKPLHFGGQHENGRQGINRPVPTKPTIPISSSSSSSSPADISSTSTSTTTSTTSTSSRPPRPTHMYKVHENVDEGVNPFVWPNWFGILNALSQQQQQQQQPSTTATVSVDDRLQNKIAPKTKVKFYEPALENKIAPKDEDYFKVKYLQARKNLKALEDEPTGNEIDGDISSGEHLLGPKDKAARVVFPDK